MFDLTLRTRSLITKNGFCDWKIKKEMSQLNPNETAIIIVDMWDRHWSTGATTRCLALADIIDATVRRAREQGALIVHAPSDTMEFYKNTDAHKRVFSALLINDIPNVKEVADYPQPIDSSDGGSDTKTIDEFALNTMVWKRQTNKIFIDDSKDIISDDGVSVYSYFRGNNIKNIIYMGVHTNMCILERSFAIKTMLSWGMNVMLCRDLTDCMYNPEKAPYVSHDEGTRLIVEYIEKFYCPTVTSDEI